MKIHEFDSTGEAYDECNCNDEIATGDVVVIASEGVIGIAWAWPVAVTATSGRLHTAPDPTGFMDTLDPATREAFDRGVRSAIACAGVTGYVADPAWVAYRDGMA